MARDCCTTHQEGGSKTGPDARQTIQPAAAPVRPARIPARNTDILPWGSAGHKNRPKSAIYKDHAKPAAAATARGKIDTSIFLYVNPAEGGPWSNPRHAGYPFGPPARDRANINSVAEPMRTLISHAYIHHSIFA